MRKKFLLNWASSTKNYNFEITQIGDRYLDFVSLVFIRNSFVFWLDL